MSRKCLVIALSAIAFTFLALTASDSTSRAAAAMPEMGKSKFKQARFEKEFRRPEGKYGFCPTCVTPACPAPCPRIERRTVLVPQWVTECKQVPATEIRHEQRDRQIIVYRDVPETIVKTRTVTFMEKKIVSHEEKFTVEKPVTEKVEQKYTVCVPYTETRTATRTVMKPVWNEVERKYTVCVPYCEKRTGLRTVEKCVPVVRTREFCVDQGHWEEHVTQTICKPVCKPVCNVCAPCAPPVPVPVAVPVTVCKTRVWVPCMVKKTECYTVNTTELVKVPYVYEVKLERPEVRTKIEKVRTLVPTPESYTYEVQLTRPETRTRFVDVCRIVPEVRTRIVNETICVPREKIETYNVTVVRRVAEKRIVKECVDVPVCVTREVQVRVQKLVPKTVEVQVAACPVCVPVCGCK